MTSSFDRRRFMKRSASVSALWALGDFGFLSALPRVEAAETKLSSDSVRFRPEIEPLVRLLEETSRAQLLEEVAGRIKTGTTYREVLTALLLAGVRNIQPRPVGFKFHAVLVVNSAHLASQNSPDGDRWLPIFWALDQFKRSQASDVREGDWTMAPVDEKALPSAETARATFIAAMDDWDEAKVDVAIAGLARGAGSQDLFDLLCRYGARDFRDIGHKAIYVANSWRTLQNMGWQHAEPVLRSLAYALLDHGGGNPAQRDEEADRPGRHNLAALKEIREGWQRGVILPEATAELLTVLRAGTWQDASDTVVKLLNRGIDPQALWDALFSHAGEMLMRLPGIITLHATTTTNALHYAYRHASDDETRRFLLLQSASFLTLFRKRGGVKDGVLIDQFAPAEGVPTLDEVFAEVGRNKMQAAHQSLAYLDGGGDAKAFLDAAQRFIYLKATDTHAYKFSSAILEDHRHLSPALRNRFLAASTSWLAGSGGADSPLVERTRSALG
jgi:hypothetical protein